MQYGRGLATAEYGTAGLAVIFTAHEQGKKIHVFADETRPLLQGARLTAWELQQHGVRRRSICDNMAGQVMKRRPGCKRSSSASDHIAANGDAANKIGTYSVAVLALAILNPFYVVAPSSTFDLTLKAGSRHSDPTHIETREITHSFGKLRIAPEGAIFTIPPST